MMSTKPSTTTYAPPMKSFIHAPTLIAVIGAGNVGATCALTLAQMKIADIVLLDIHEGVAKGKALDMSQNGTVLNYDGRVTGTSSYQDIAGGRCGRSCHVGVPSQPGMTRRTSSARTLRSSNKLGRHQGACA